jgi:hypothetical protein
MAVIERIQCPFEYVQPCRVIARGTRPGHQGADDPIPVRCLRGQEGMRFANESVERGKVRRALILQVWCGLRGGLKRDDRQDEPAEARSHARGRATDVPMRPASRLNVLRPGSSYPQRQPCAMPDTARSVADEP